MEGMYGGWWESLRGWSWGWGVYLTTHFPLCQNEQSQNSTRTKTRYNSCWFLTQIFTQVLCKWLWNREGRQWYFCKTAPVNENPINLTDFVFQISYSLSALFLYNLICQSYLYFKCSFRVTHSYGDKICYGPCNLHVWLQVPNIFVTSELSWKKIEWGVVGSNKLVILKVWVFPNISG